MMTIIMMMIIIILIIIINSISDFVVKTMMHSFRNTSVTDWAQVIGHTEGCWIT
jgi:hypothetical protein